MTFTDNQLAWLLTTGGIGSLGCFAWLLGMEYRRFHRLCGPAAAISILAYAAFCAVLGHGAQSACPLGR